MKMPPKLKRLGRPPGSKNKKKDVVMEKKKWNTIKIEEVEIEGPDHSNVVDNDVDPDTLNISDTDGITLLHIEVDNGNDFLQKSKKFHCKECTNKYFKLEQNYLEHLLMEHSTTPGSIACNKCNVVCPNEEILDMHHKKAHGKPAFSCENCGKTFVRQAHVFRHMDQKGCGKSVAKFPCEICHAIFTRKDNLIVHLRESHMKVKMFFCKSCQFNSKNQTKLIRHWHAKHSGTPNQFICDHCNKSTSSRAAMTKHLEIHGEKKYSCAVCSYSTFTVEVMRRHILTHVNNKPYKCSVCGSSYIQRSQLQRHMEKHRIQCSYCKESLNIEHLQSHMEKHKGESRLVCPLDFCSRFKKEFPDMVSLIEHLQIHGKKSYSCELCNKKFPEEANMRRHMSTHTLDRPRRCMYCVSARAYVRGVQLVRHVRRYHAHVFAAHLAHVRQVLKVKNSTDRVTKSEMESILTMLDVESERILEGYGGPNVLYGGMQLADTSDEQNKSTDSTSSKGKDSDSPLMSEEMLAEQLSQLLIQLVDADTLECLGWPDESIDVVLEKVIENCGAKPADRDKWTRVQRLRENAKHLFLYVVDDRNVAKMLDTHTIDQIIKHILQKVTEDNEDSEQEDEEQDE